MTASDTSFSSSSNPTKGITMPHDLLALPYRTVKPRDRGLTMVMDTGLPTAYFEDAMNSAATHIDVVKFGWGTSLVTADLGRKIACLRDIGIRFYFGGTLFEKFVVQNSFAGFLKWCEQWGADTVEISNGTISLTNTEKAAYIRQCVGSFRVFSEVGFKDPVRNQLLSPEQWVESIEEDLGAGAEIVVTETRESGRSGLCTADGELRVDLLEHILSGTVDVDQLLFEAPTKELQAEFVRRVGTNVNLGNIAVADVIGVETLRLGLRADTLPHFESQIIHA
jgi:phosphosulfolactate synthase